MRVNLNYKGYKQIDFQDQFRNQKLLAVQIELYLSVKQSKQRSVGLFCGDPFLLSMTMESNLFLTLPPSIVVCYVWSLYKVSKVQEIMRLTEKCITDVLYNL